MQNTISEISQKLQKGEISSQEITRYYLDKIRTSGTHAYLSVNDEEAISTAEAADKLIQSGKHNQLTGIPLSVKDAILTANTRNTAASKILDKFMSPYNATVIKKIKAQSAVIIGKTNLDEFAMGASTENSAYGASFNPHDLTRVPGGSSGGSAAAVAEDLCTGSLGSDTGGSIRQPAAMCGVTGFKPTYGRVSRNGLIAMASSLDQIGPITKTAKDAKILFDVITGYDELDATSIKTKLPIARALKGLKIGIIKEHIEHLDLDGDVVRGTQASINTLKHLGCDIEEIDVPSLKYTLAVYYLIMPVEVSSNLARYDGIKYGSSVLKDKDINSLQEVYIKTRSRYLGAEVKRRIILGAYTSSAGYYDEYYVKAKKTQELIKRDFAKAFKKVDVIVGSTAPTPAFKLGDKASDPMQMYLCDIFTVPANIAGLPAISVPAYGKYNLPIGFQMIGAKDSDLTILNLAITFEDYK